jgi:hypothetical protein
MSETIEERIAADPKRLKMLHSSSCFICDIGLGKQSCMNDKERVTLRILKFVKSFLEKHIRMCRLKDVSDVITALRVMKLFETLRNTPTVKKMLKSVRYTKIWHPGSIYYHLKHLCVDYDGEERRNMVASIEMKNMVIKQAKDTADPGIIANAMRVISQVQKQMDASKEREKELDAEEEDDMEDIQKVIQDIQREIKGVQRRTHAVLLDDGEGSAGGVRARDGGYCFDEDDDSMSGELDPKRAKRGGHGVRVVDSRRRSRFVSQSYQDGDSETCVGESIAEDDENLDEHVRGSRVSSSVDRFASFS